MILVAYRHGLRASELCDLQWHQIELEASRLHVHRAKRGTPSVHPIRGDELRALRRLQRESPAESYVFVSERGGPMSRIGFHRLPAARRHHGVPLARPPPAHHAWPMGRRRCEPEEFEQPLLWWPLHCSDHIPDAG
jgi:integrase